MKKASFPKGSEDPYLNLKKVDIYESIFVACDSIQDESFVSRSISHQYNCHHVFFTRELLVPYARLHMACELALCFTLSFPSPPR